MAAGDSKITQVSGKKFSVLKRGDDDACLQIPAFGWLKQKDHEFKTTLGNTLRHCLKRGRTTPPPTTINSAFIYRNALTESLKLPMSMNLAQPWSVHQGAFWYPNFSHSFFYIHYLSFAPREDSFTSLQNIQLENPWEKTEELLPCPTPPVSPFTSCLSLPPYKTKAGWCSKNNFPWGSRMTQSPSPHLDLVKDWHQNGQMSQLSSSPELTTLQLGSLEEEVQRPRSPSFLSKGEE